MKKYVFTGGPMTGKSSVINFLRENGSNVLTETATVLINTGNYGNLKNLSPEALEEFNNEIIKSQYLREELAYVRRGADEVFLDRSMVDQKAYFEFRNLPLPEKFKDFQFSGRYDKVFLFQQFPLKQEDFANDPSRLEKDIETGRAIHEKLIKTYKDLGYNLIDVSIFSTDMKESIQKRVEFILDEAYK